MQEVTIAISFSLLWAFLPLLALAGVAIIAKVIPKLDIPLRRLAKIPLGLGSQDNKGICLQTKEFDCGTAALRNSLDSLGVYDSFQLPEPSTMKDLAVTAETFGLFSAGYDNTTLELVRQTLDSGGKILTLVKVIYPFAGWWVRPTAWILNFFIGDRVQGVHWVMLDSIDDKRIYMLDPYFGRIKMGIEFFKKCWSRRTLVINSPKVVMTSDSAGNN